MKLFLAAIASLVLVGGDALATIVLHEPASGPPSVTPLGSLMDGDFFLDNATVGGGDVNKITATPVTARDFNMNGFGGPAGVPGVLTIQSFAFATGAGASDNDAAGLQLTFLYLGQDEVFGGGDDVLLGSTEFFGYNTADPLTGWSGAGRYYVNFATDPSAVIDGLGNRFRITITPEDLPLATSGVRFKSSGTGGSNVLDTAKFSFSGTFAAIPEPFSMLFFGGLGAVGALLRRRPPAD